MSSPTATPPSRMAAAAASRTPRSQSSALHRDPLEACQACRSWEAVVIGAGPAGAAAALRLAAAGVEVLLVDRQSFPRYKVCGSCLSGAAWAALEELGVGRRLHALAPVVLRELRLAGWGRQATLPLSGGAVLSRAALDTAIVEAAVAAGAAFLPGVRASLGAAGRTARVVRLHGGERAFDIEAGVVVLASGLRGGLARGTGTARGSIGAGVVLEEAPDAYARGTVYMAVGDGGYVGLARLEDGRLDVAAALDAAAVRAAGAPGAAVASILRSAGLPTVDDIALAAWHGTPPLRHRPPVLAVERLFLIGDAAGYVEPFTGEGIGWALESARAVAPIVMQAAHAWEPRLARQWELAWRRCVGRRQRICRALSWVLRRPRWSRSSMAALERMPAAAAPLVRRFGVPGLLGAGPP